MVIEYIRAYIRCRNVQSIEECGCQMFPEHQITVFFSVQNLKKIKFDNRLKHLFAIKNCSHLVFNWEFPNF